MTFNQKDNENIVRMLVGETVGDAIDTTLVPETIELRDQQNDIVGYVSKNSFDSLFSETISLTQIRKVEILDCLYYVHNDEKSLTLFIEV